ncbi:hypothetical protein [Levilactobacillus yonginensis]|uniref:hypothetical protein n=1 Tax=Levilactobacillus yonginensis TaxID=1054041 RepID=UPI000F772457|nr:hypothetical protein [Levilactobacillus yonginensis]
MKPIIQGFLILVVAIGAWVGGNHQALANSQYSATRSRSVRLVWRRSMGRHALVATQGARYSRHLGVRYSNNDVTLNVVWYTDAHEKLYEKDKHKNAIYYHVKSADGTLSGWIWRGYLKSATKHSASTITGPVTVDNLDWTKTRASKREAQMMQLFPGATYDASVFQAADTILTIDDAPDVADAMTEMGTQKFLDFYKVSYRQFKRINFVAKDPDSVASIAQGLSAAGYSQTARKQFAGWHIGGSLIGPDDGNDDNILEGTVPGEGYLILVKK